MPKPVVFLGMPHYGDVNIHAARAFYALASSGDKCDLIHADIPSSLLCKAFNQLWCVALNWREKYNITHFGMLHADIVPADDWLDTLLDELERTGADLVSCVVPIKSGEGVTSTAIDSAGDPFDVGRRLTMREVMQLPETFSAADCGYPDRVLCINTGCWLCKFDGAWVEKVHFNIKDAIVRDADGTFRPKVMSEDWDFSRQLHRLGLDVRATRKVALRHVGGHAYRNDTPWGTYEVDHMAGGVTLPSLEPQAVGLESSYAMV